MSMHRVLCCLFLLATFCSAHRQHYGRQQHHGRGGRMPQAQGQQGQMAPQPQQQVMNNGQGQPGQQIAPQPQQQVMNNGQGQPGQKTVNQPNVQQPQPGQPVQQGQTQQNSLPNNAVANPASANQPASQSSAPQQQQRGATDSLAEIFTAEHFNKLKPADPNCQGASLYTYEAFLQAATTLFPAFGTTGDVTARKHDVAGFFAHVMHETGLCFVDEQGGAAQDPKQYCQASQQYPCAPGANYHGRGPLQISWNYNYIDFGKTLGEQQGADIYQHPEHISASGVLLFQSSLYFYMRQNQPDSMHNLMLKNPPAFGVTTKVINGALECGGGNSAQVNSRSKFFVDICAMLGVDPGTELTC